MRRKLKVFFAGKVDPTSTFVSSIWRDELVWALNKQLTNYTVADSCLFLSRNRYIAENNLPINIIFAQSCFYISQSDVLVVNLSDDISVGGSHEIFMAKQFNIPVIGIAPRGGKFNRLRYDLGGKTYWNWIHPFAVGLCDVVVHDINELAEAIDAFDAVPNRGINAINDSIEYYQRNAAALDTSVNRILSYTGLKPDSKQRLRIYFAGKMGKASGFSAAAWRDEFAEIISRSSRFSAVNLDFLEVSHSVVDENNGKLIFGRDAYLIRSSDVVVVNLSDDISVGGAAEMMLAKLYHRPLIGIANQNGKFLRAEKNVFGNLTRNYVNPFVANTCDWLIRDPQQLPATIDQLFTGKVKTNAIIPASAQWYQREHLRNDLVAKFTFGLA